MLRPKRLQKSTKSIDFCISSFCHVALKSRKPSTDNEFDNRYFTLLQQCTASKSLTHGKQLHAHLIKHGLFEHKKIFVANNLLNMYAKCGDMEDARHVFHRMPARNVVSWTAMIAGYAQHGNGNDAVDLFILMHRAGVLPNQFTLSSVFRACAEFRLLHDALQFHAIAVKAALSEDVFVGSALVDLFTKCGSLDDARLFFDTMKERNIVTWTSMITGYVQTEQRHEALQLFCEMHKGGFTHDGYTIASVASACAVPAFILEGLQVHALAIRCGLHLDLSVRNTLIDMYAKCGCTNEARSIFDQKLSKDAVSWTTMVTGYAQNSQFQDALKLFMEMLQTEANPDQFTYASLISVSADVGALEEGRQFHAQVIVRGLDSDAYVQHTLVDLYARSQSFEDALSLLDKIHEKTVVLYNTLIAAYAQHGVMDRPFELFTTIQRMGMMPNQSTFVNVLRACAAAPCKKHGEQVHAHLIKTTMRFDVVVGTALMDMYSIYGCMLEAKNIFLSMPEHDILSWNSIIGGYGMNGHGEEAARIYKQMLNTGLSPNHLTFITLMSVSADLANLEQGIQFHTHLVKAGFEMDCFVGNAMIDMYAKCGMLDSAYLIFDKMTGRDVVCWNVMISRYGQHGYGKNALKLFDQMLEAGLLPNHITFVGVLSACSHAGLVEEGWHHFESMKATYGIEPRMEHYSCMVDLLSRSGFIKEARDLVEGMPFEPGVELWRALLGACTVHGDVELARHAAKRALELEPNQSGSYILMSNIYSAAGMQKDATAMRKLMYERGVKKEPGKSWIGIHNKVNVFVAGDRSHPQTDAIYAKLASLTDQIKKAGYVPDVNLAFHDMEQEEKEYNIIHHSEKLAVAFALLNSADGTHIRIFKNLRVCGDCHTAFKFISKIFKREIVLRDKLRFHHFNDGLCSCGDFW